MSYVSLQTDWWRWCQEHLDPAIERGTPKSETLITHLEVEEYKAARSEVALRMNRATEVRDAKIAVLTRLIKRLEAMELTVEEREELRLARKVLKFP
jgi:hypothetical protein